MRPRSAAEAAEEVTRLIRRNAGGNEELVKRAHASKTKRCMRLQELLDDAVIFRENHEASRYARMLVAAAAMELNGGIDGE